MITKDRLYELAFMYKKSKLWLKLWDTEMFAVRFSDGETGYVCIMGKGGTFNALNVYTGDAGYSSYIKMMNAGEPSPDGNLFEERERLLQQDCVQVSFSSYSETDYELIREVRDYAKRNGIRLSGKNAYPVFSRFNPNKHPWFVSDETDMQHIAEAMECALWIAGELKTCTAAYLGICALDEDTEVIPLFERDGDRYRASECSIPEEQPEVYPCPAYIDEIAASRIRKLKKKVCLECQVIRWPHPIQNKRGERPFYPVLLLAVDADSGFSFSSVPVADYENNPVGLINALTAVLLKHKVSVSVFEVMDNRTYTLLRPLALSLGARISMEDELPALFETRDFFEVQAGLAEDYEDFDDEDPMPMMLDEMEKLPDSELENIPDYLVASLESLLECDDVPPEVEVRIKRLLKRAGKI